MKTGDECGSAKSFKAVRRRDTGSGVVSDRVLARLKRCEELLEANGVKIENEPANGDRDNARDTASASKAADGHMIVERGHSRYIERKGYPLSSLSSCIEN